MEGHCRPWSAIGAAESAARRVIERLGAVELACVEAIAQPEGGEADYVVRADGDENAFCTFTARALAQWRALGWRVDVDAEYPFRVVEREPSWYARIEPSEERAGWFGLELGVELDGDARRPPAGPARPPRAARRGRRPRRARRVLPLDVGAAIDARPTTSRCRSTGCERSCAWWPSSTRASSGAAARSPRCGRARWSSSTTPFATPGAPHRLDRSARASPTRARARVGAAEDRRGPQRLARDAAPLPERRGRVPPAPARERRRRRARRRDGARQDAPDDRPLVHREERRAPRRAGARRRPDDARRQLGARARAVRARASRRRPARPRAARPLARPSARRDVVVTTYPVLVRDEERFAEHRFSPVVLDEAQAIKNARSQARRALARVVCRQPRVPHGDAGREPPRRALVDLRLARARPARRRARVPALLAPADRAARRRRAARRPSRAGRAVRAAAPQAATWPRSFRPRRSSRCRSSSGGKQRELYESIRVAAHADVRKAIRSKGLAASAITILDALTKLRQVCCDPRLVAHGRGARA